ncbi:MAG: hypothetical protein RL616_766, partial [Verrucomicrobiota bacterium]
MPASVASQHNDRKIAATAPSDLTLQIVKEIAARPYVPSAELCHKFEITRTELKNVYAHARICPTAQGLFVKSPFFYLTKVLERLGKDKARTIPILHGEIPQPPFEVLELFISADCNVNCTFCYRRDRDYGDQRILSTAEFLAIINEFADLGGRQMDVSGGLEPLLSPAIADVFKVGIARGLRVNLYTIGNALHNPKIADPLMQLSQIR